MDQVISIIILIVAVTSGIIALITNIVNYRSAKAKAEEATTNRIADKIELTTTLEKQMTFIKERTNALEAKLVDLFSLVKGHVDNETFEHYFNDTLSDQVKDIVGVSSNIHQKYKTLMLQWSKVIAELGTSFYKSSYRTEGKKRREKSLREEMNSMIDDFTIYMNSMVDEVKMDTAGRRLLFVDFVKGVDIHRRTQLLVMSLERNGLTSETYTPIFTDYQEDFFASFLNVIYLWSNLPNYKFQEVA